jgi:hypothetical protein
MVVVVVVVAARVVMRDRGYGQEVAQLSVSEHGMGHRAAGECSEQDKDSSSEQ